MDTNSTTEVAPKAKPKGRIRRFLLRALLVLIVVAIAAHFAWKYSGSNQWKVVEARKGVTLYSRKVPGATVEQFKAVWKVNSKISRFVMWASDTKGDSMRKVTGLYDLKLLGREGEKVSWTAWKQPLASFLQPREFVIRSEFAQDPTTRVLLYTVKAVPDKLPPNDCCVRIPFMDNSWTLTPLKSGEIQVEWFVNMHLGGTIPYFLQNAVQPDGMLRFAPKVQKFIDLEKYKDARYDWIQEGAPDQVN